MLSQRIIIFLAVVVPCIIGGPQQRSSGRTGGGSHNLALNKNAKSGSDLFGDGVKGTTWRAFNSKEGHPLTEDNRLDCGFESDCCWGNEDGGDQLDWTLYKGDTDEKRLKQKFGNGDKPTGSFLAVVSSNAGSKTHDARFGSCSIACAQGDVQVTLKYWTTKDVKLSVCTRKALLGKEKGALENCKGLSDDSGVAIVILPARRNEVFDVVIVADNLVNSTSAAIIDDISVSYKQCINSNTKTQSNGKDEAPATAMPASKEECARVTCDFENDDTCSYVDNSKLNEQSANDTFQVRVGRFKNPVTGIVRAAAGTRYSAAYLKHGSVAKLEATVKLSHDRVIRFQHYEATAGIQMKGCCDGDDNCPFQTNPEVNAVDLKWSTASFQCPAGTKKILFVCKNDAKNEGACGVDSIELFGGSPDPDASIANLCQSL
uniref:MAM domain-containing protein n=1 Tax=Plectus sambesii TaxID=2011161 RepID=A0A914W7B6_9BILA